MTSTLNARRELARLLLILATLAVPALLGACGAAKPVYPGRLALVIGNAHYSQAPSLKNPVNDAQDLCLALQALRFQTLCQTDVPDRAAFETLVQRYTQALGPDTVGVVFYSGHGMQAAGQNFLIPTQAQARSVVDDPLRVMYRLQDLFEQLRLRPSKLQLVVLDACRSDLPAAAPGARPGLAAVQDAPPGTLVLYATASGEAAYDGLGRNGPLTHHLLQNIRRPGLSVEDLLKKVTAGVEGDTRVNYQRRQTPFVYGSFSGRFCFAGCADELITPVPN